MLKFGIICKAFGRTMNIFLKFNMNNKYVVVDYCKKKNPISTL